MPFVRCRAAVLSFCFAATPVGLHASVVLWCCVAVLLCCHPACPALLQFSPVLHSPFLLCVMSSLLCCTHRSWCTLCPATFVTPRLCYPESPICYPAAFCPTDVLPRHCDALLLSRCYADVLCCAATLLCCRALPGFSCCPLCPAVLC
jgi:hypothetical protein